VKEIIIQEEEVIRKYKEKIELLEQVEQGKGNWIKEEGWI